SACSCSAAATRSTPARTRSSATSSASGRWGSPRSRHERSGMTTTPTPPPGRDLLRDKVVLVTAAAGTGIGNATARRCIEEGATVVISDAHERRLGEAADALAELAGGTRPAAFMCDVTV